ncbi:MAG: M48 family metallopeptidase [Gammaproteobacteria bacterium]|nr:M48 family metallopeptidase [Gammaproteobacteria bacterium]
MSGISANYYDGQSSKRHAVSIQLDANGMLSIHGDSLSACYPLDEITMAYRIGKRVRMIKLSDGASLEAETTPELDAILDQTKQHKHQGLVHRLESKLKYIVMALLLTIAFAFGFLTWGVPALAKSVAFSLPVETQDYLGEGTMEVFDEYFMQPSKLDKTRQAAIEKRFQALISGLDERDRYELLFRDSEKMGANAFALPSGSIVLTDQFIALAENEKEIDSVLAHEIGHVHFRHSLRGAIQSSSAAVLIALMTGDVASMSSFAATLPTLLVNMNYSRQFETEADNYAKQLMKEKGIEFYHFARILTRLTASHDVADDDDSLNFLSSHPSTKERIKSFQ